MGVIWSICAFLCIPLCDSKLNLGKIIPLSPIKCPGKIFIAENEMKDAVFLCRSGRLEVIQNDDRNSNTVTICDVVPLSLSFNPFSGKGIGLFVHRNQTKLQNN